ncbi:MAG: hypothetical protein ACRDUV_00640 [Pseudonocardiaceae bacterium]
MANSTLASAVRELAERPQLGIHCAPLRDLADALDGRANLASWATVDLVNTFGRPDLFRDRLEDRGGEAWITQILQSVLVFVPIIVTWIGLALATAAYQDMISAPDGTAQVAGRSFLQLWQQGFDGHLAAPFTFFWMAVYTVLALTAVIAVTLRGAWRGRRAEQLKTSDRQSLMAELIPALVRAQVAACEEQHASPARFADELSGAAGQLGALLDDTLSAQQGLRYFGDLAQRLSQQLTIAATAVESASGELGRSADAGRTAMEGTQAALAALKHTVTDHVESSTQRITAVAEQAALQTEEVGKAGEYLLAEMARRVNEQLATSVERQGRLLSDLTDRVDGAVQALRHACDQLSGAGTGLSATLGQAGREGAEAIAESYRLAVATVVTSLGREMTGIGANLAERVEDLQAITERYAEQTRLASTEQGVHLAAVGRAAATIQDVVRSGAEGLATTLAAAREVTVELRTVAHRLAELRGNTHVAFRASDPPGGSGSVSSMFAAADGHGESP